MSQESAPALNEPFGVGRDAAGLDVTGVDIDANAESVFRKSYRIDDWVSFVKRKQAQSPLGTDYLRHLATLNYDGRTIFYLQK